MRLNFRTLPPSVISQEPATPEPEGAPRFFTDSLRPPEPAECHYWDVDLECWLPIITPPKIVTAVKTDASDFYRSYTDAIRALNDKLRGGRRPQNSYSVNVIGGGGSGESGVYSGSSCGGVSGGGGCSIAVKPGQSVSFTVGKDSSVRNSPYEPVVRVLRTPADVFEYLHEHYSDSELNMRYSDLRQQLGPLPITLYVDPEHPEGIATLMSTPYGGKERIVNLTDREESDNLDVSSADSNEEKRVSILSREEAAAAYKRASAALAELDRLEAKYSPDLPDGSVIAFKLTFASNGPLGGNTFSYAAIRAVGLWYPTGKINTMKEAGTGLAWSDLLEAFEVRSATDFEVLRTGGDSRELGPASDDVDEIPASRTVVVDGKLNAFDEPDDNA